MLHVLYDTRLVIEFNAMTYIEIGDWTLMQSAAQAVRTAVFVQEQGIAPEDEWDADDATALHAVLFGINGQPLGNARLLQPCTNIAKVGRMAVLPHVRGQGYGGRLLHVLVREARRRGNKEVHLNAQLSAEKFYAAFGFQAVGEPFDEVNIAHVKMHLDLI
jgi:predicted GNAT family N-acyltransferase